MQRTDDISQYNKMNIGPNRNPPYSDTNPLIQFSMILT